METYRGLWFCRPCLESMAATNEKPFMTADDLDGLAAAQDEHPAARRWEEWPQLDQQPGGSSEPQQEPVQFAPLPPYAYPTTPDHKRTHGPGEPEQVPEIQRGQDQEHLREPPTDRHSPSPGAVSVPVPPARPRPTQHAPIEPTPIRRPEPTPSAPVIITHLVQPGAPPEHARPTPRQTMRAAPPNNSESIPEQCGINAESIPADAQQGAPDLPVGERPDAPVLPMPAFQKESDVGRKRKNEDTGIYGDIPIKDVVLFRHIKKRQWPGMSDDMRYWYEWFYFKPPVVGEKPFRGKSYEQHERAYRRGQAWIAAYEAERTVRAGDAGAQALGHSGAAVIPFHQRASR